MDNNVTTQDDVHVPGKERITPEVTLGGLKTPFKDEPTIIPGGTIPDSVCVPSGEYDVLVEFWAQAHATIENLSDGDKKLSREEALKISTNLASVNKVTKDNAFGDALARPGMVNDMSKSGLNSRRLVKPVTGEVSGQEAINAFTVKMGLGEPIHSRCVHSGIWLTLRSPTNDALINLDYILAKEEVRIGRDTSSLIYSNEDVLYASEVIDFILDHVDDTNVIIDDIGKLRGLLKITDLWTVIVDLSTAMYPNGYAYSRTCGNGFTVDGGDIRDTCSTVATGMLDSSLLTYTDQDSITPDMAEFLGRLSPNSVTVDEVLKYQESISDNGISTRRIIDSNGTGYVFTIRTPTWEQYLSSGRLWVDDLTSQINSIVGEGSLYNQSISDLTAAVALGAYNSYLIKIESDDGLKVIDPMAMYIILSRFSSDQKVLTGYLEFVSTHINTKTITAVGVPVYTCPGCRGKEITENKLDEITEGLKFNKFIPINVLQHFFDLNALRMEAIRKLTMS